MRLRGRDSYNVIFGSCETHGDVRMLSDFVGKIAQLFIDEFAFRKCLLNVI